MKKGLLTVVIVVLLVGVVFFMNQSSDQARDARPEKGFKAPDFTLLNIENEEVTLSKLQGKPVFINFWASWCPPCKEEMPFIQEAYEKYGDKVHFLGVNVTVGDSKEDAIAFMQANKYQMPILFDYEGEASKIYRASSIPKSFFIDKNGIIKTVHPGPMNFNQIESYLKEILED